MKEPIVKAKPRKARFSKRTIVFTPNEPLVASMPTVEGEITLEGETFTVPVRLFVAPVSLPKDLADDLRGYECRIGSRMYLFAGTKGGKSENALARHQLLAEEKRPAAYRELTPLFLKYFAKVSYILGGTRIIMHEPPLSKSHEQIRDKDDVLHVFIGCAPSRPSNYAAPLKICGVDVETSIGYHHLLAVTEGRGFAVSDGTYDIAQVLGNNIYLLYNPYFLYETGVDIEGATALFRKMIARAVNAWCTRKNMPVAPETPRGTISELALSMVTSSMVNMTRVLEEHAEEISELEAQLRQKKREHESIRRLYRLTCADTAHHAATAARLVADVERIAVHPDVERIIATERGFIVYTKYLRLLHEGIFYRLGAYAIHFGLDASLIVWTEESLHPDSVPHPHISPQNGPCFGNIGDVIDDAIAECRYADAFDAIMLWLTQGYTPELALFNKIEEWPKDSPLSCPSAETISAHTIERNTDVELRATAQSL